MLTCQDADKVKRTLDEYFSVKMETKDVSLRGYNWGQASVESESIDLCV
jgi:structure-specific recognition protein 1